MTAWIGIVWATALSLVAVSVAFSGIVFACMLAAWWTDAGRQHRAERAERAAMASSPAARGDLVDLAFYRAVRRARRGATAERSVAQRSEDLRRVERAIVGEGPTR